MRDEWGYPQLLLLWGLSFLRISVAAFKQKNEYLDDWVYLGVNPLDMPYQASEGKHSKQPIMTYHTTLNHHLCIIHLIN